MLQPFPTESYKRIAKADGVWYTDAMNGSISHDRRGETIEAKTRWFRSLPLSERMDLFCAFTDLALAVNPGLAERKHAEPIPGRVQVLSKA